MSSLKINQGNLLYFQKIVYVLVIFLVIVFSFNPYYRIPEQVDLYRMIDDDDYRALLFLADQPKGGKILAIPFIATAIYPISGLEPLATLTFYNPHLRGTAQQFFVDAARYKKCFEGSAMYDELAALEIKYILINHPMEECDFKLIYQENNNYIYRVSR